MGLEGRVSSLDVEGWNYGGGGWNLFQFVPQIFGRVILLFFWNKITPPNCSCAQDAAGITISDRPPSLRAGPAEMTFENWYTANTNHFRLTAWQISVRRKSKTQLGWVINPVLHYLVRRIRFWRIKSLEQDFKNLYYSSIPGNRNWQIETADWNLNVCLDIWVKKRNSMHA